MVAAGHASAQSWQTSENGWGCTKAEACTTSDGETDTALSNCDGMGEPETVTGTTAVWFTWRSSDNKCIKNRSITTCAGTNTYTSSVSVYSSSLPCPSPTPSPSPTPTPSPCADRDPEWAFALEGGTGCQDGCEVTISGPANNDIRYGSCIGGDCSTAQGGYVAGVTYTGNQCQQGDTHESREERCYNDNGREICPDTYNPNCASFADGSGRVCVNENDQCGTVNGRTLCPGDNDCFSLSDGSLVCPFDMDPPLKEDNSGDPEEPEGVIGNEDGDTFILYGGGHLGEELGPSPGPTPGPTPGNCPAGEANCTGSVVGGGSSARSFSDSAQVVGDAWRGSEFYGSAVAMRDAMPSGGGQCPTIEFEVPFWNRTFTIDAHCDIAEENRAIIASIMFVVWGVIALYIVVRA